MRFLFSLAISIGSVVYPFLWWWWQGDASALKLLAVCMAGLWLLRAVMSRDVMRFISSVLAGLFILAAFARQGQWLVWYPFAVNLLMLALFAASLWHGKPVIERFARLRHPDLPAEALPYLRRVTQIWCGFFIFNAGLIAILIFQGNMRWWTLYTGCISYLLMGVLLGGEWVYRQWMIKKNI